MKTIVITGSTRGIGLGLAEALLQRGCEVVISGRNPTVVEQIAAGLADIYGLERVVGVPCDVSDYDQVQALWDAAKNRFGEIDIWINNAGIGNLLTPFWELEPETMKSVMGTNVLGTMYGSKVAILGMIQQGHGWLYNMEGFGSGKNMRVQPGLTLYGSTKAAVSFVDQSLAAELAGKPVMFGSIQPGMVVTDMLLNQQSGSDEDWNKTKWIMNILAEKVETVAPWIADEILKNDKHGRHISHMSTAKVMWRFISSPILKRKVVD